MFESRRAVLVRLSRVFGRRREEPALREPPKGAGGCGEGHGDRAVDAGAVPFPARVYVLSPTTPDGLPPGDGALLLTRDHGDEGLILWTLGPLVCEPMPAPKKLMDYLAQVKSGADGDGM